MEKQHPIGDLMTTTMHRLLEKQTKIHTALAEDPVNCVAIGTGKSFQRPHLT